MIDCPNCPACRDEPDPMGSTEDRMVCPNDWCVVVAWDPHLIPTLALREAESVYD